MITKAQARYTEGTKVEVFTYDIRQGGRTWQPGAVERVDVAGEKFIDVVVRMADDYRIPVRLGPRGAAKNVIRIVG